MASRKRKPLTLREKVNILAVVDRDPKRSRSTTLNGKELTSPRTSDCLRRRDEAGRGAKHGELEDALLKWFKQARASGVNFDGSILREKVMEIADIMGIEDFAASNGWMDRFRVRHGISYRQVNGEAASVNPADIENWIALLPGIVNAYAPRDVYNADELGLFFKVLFEVFLQYLDGRLGSKDRKGLLFLDNCLAHPKDTSFLRNLRVLFLPTNTTSHLQPLDAGIIKNVKHLYRKCIDPGKLTLLDAMHYLNASWESVTSETVKNCFRKCGFRRSPEVEEPEPCTEDDDMDEEFRSAGAKLAFSDFVTVDDDVPTCDPQTVADIAAVLRQGQVTGDEHDDDEDQDGPEMPPRATFAQAVAALDVLRSYFATKDNPAANVTKTLSWETRRRNLGR
ncbi:hypothetical protein HPB47_005912 [Ixodes persulcatus]|uniref:Uncharacterized protein n=1 Tax=Ixodes persulcatus TaxID=34615 RepID=A0AC60PC84_IXOPE|nr:hypothetical protein HPB47_005912 [Ixodes persulcatus]